MGGLQAVLRGQRHAAGVRPGGGPAEGGGVRRRPAKGGLQHHPPLPGPVLLHPGGQRPGLRHAEQVRGLRGRRPGHLAERLRPDHGLLPGGPGLPGGRAGPVSEDAGLERGEYGYADFVRHHPDLDGAVRISA